MSIVSQIICGLAGATLTHFAIVRWGHAKTTIGLCVIIVIYVTAAALYADDSTNSAQGNNGEAQSRGGEWRGN